MAETVKQYGHGKMKEILEVFSRSITTINNLDKISTGEVFRAQKNLLSGSKPVGYPVGGMPSVTKKFADYITSNGSEIHLNTTVDKILIKDGKAIGVVVGDKKYSSDFVVSNVLVQNLFSLADEKYFPKEYVKYIKSLDGTGSLCAYYSLNKVDSGLVGKIFHFIERDVGVDGDDVVGMIDFMTSSPDSNLSPSGSFLVQSYIICTPDEAKDKKTLKTLRELLDKNLECLIPNYKQDLNWAIYPAVWHLDGVAKTINNEKPDLITPVDNLYLIGDCVKAAGIGINCATASAQKLIEIFDGLNI
jgi:phytoene dehydrogenase-like protein